MPHASYMYILLTCINFASGGVDKIRKGLELGELLAWYYYGGSHSYVSHQITILAV